jgi:hypothetical protein
VTSALVSATVTGLFLTTLVNAGPGPLKTLTTLVVLSLLAAAAALRPWPLIMIALFVPMFVPLGFYLLGSPSYVATIGISHLVYLACAVAGLAAGRSNRPVDEKG